MLWIFTKKKTKKNGPVKMTAAVAKLRRIENVPVPGHACMRITCAIAIIAFFAYDFVAVVPCATTAAGSRTHESYTRPNNRSRIRLGSYDFGTGPPTRTSTIRYE